MALTIINNPYSGGGGSGAAFGAGLGQSLSQGLSKMLEQQAEQQLYNLGLARQEQQVQKQVSALAPFLKSQGQGELAELLIRNPQVGIQLLKSQQNEKLWQQEANSFNNLRQLIQGQPTEQTPTSSGAVSGIPTKSIGVQTPSIPGQQTPKMGTQMPSLTALKPGQALPLAKFIQDIEQSNISNDLKRKKIEQVERHFAQQQALREKKEQFAQENKKRATETEQAEKYLEPKRKAFSKIGDLSDRLNEYEKILVQDKAFAGPVFGRLGQFTASTARLNQLAQQILTDEIVSTQGGGRGSDLLRKIIQGGKLSPTQPVDTQLKYIRKAKNAIKKLSQEEEIIDKVIEEKGYAPANIKNIVKKELKKIEKEETKSPDVSQLPDPKTYKGKGFIDEETGRQIKVVDGKWQSVED